MVVDLPCQSQLCAVEHSFFCCPGPGFCFCSLFVWCTCVFVVLNKKTINI